MQLNADDQLNSGEVCIGSDSNGLRVLIFSGMKYLSRLL